MTVQTVPREQRVTTLWEAEEIYAAAEKALGLWKGKEDEAIHLFRGQVVENDAPGSGRSDQQGIEPFVELCGQTVFRKLLHLDEPAGGAQLAFIAKERQGNQATLRFVVNGREALRSPSPEATPEARQYWELHVGEWTWSRWYYVEIPPEALKKGENEIFVAAMDGQSGWQLMVADYRDFYKGMADPVVLPHASTRSQDGGRTWEEERGEYMLRLVLDSFRSRGKLVFPVLDAAGEQQAAVKSGRTVRELSLDWEAETPEGTQLCFALRTGATPTCDSVHWSAWQPCEKGERVGDVRGRYVQWKAEFITSNPQRTPALKIVQLDAGIQEREHPPLRVVRADNAQILRSSWEMPHERYDCELLQELRRRCELDAVVASAQTEFKKIQRLHQWAYRIPLGHCTHFPWNVLDWIRIERDDSGAIRMGEYQQRRRDKMCLYPNVVLVAACQSFGIPARHLNFHSEGMTGHEIAEVWSNDYGKWIHLDATRDYYWHDPKTLAPLDTQEIHQALVERLERVERWDRPYLFHQDLDALVEDLPITFCDGAYEHSVAEGALFLFRSFCHFRIIPRFDVFSRERPLPVSQGTEVWSWNGYLNWADDRVPPLAHFTHHTNRRADFYPTLNQSRYTVERTDEARQLRVHLETETPDFATFQVRTDGETWQESAARFDWALHEGLNVLEARSRNRAGMEGIISALSVEV